jgi:hypothetical protein
MQSQSPTRVLVKRCYSFGSATFLPDDNGNFQSVDKWQNESIELALDAVKKSIGTSQTLVVLDTERDEKIPIDVTLAEATAMQPSIVSGAANDKKLFTITVFTRLKTL